MYHKAYQVNSPKPSTLLFITVVSVISTRIIQLRWTLCCVRCVPQKARHFKKTSKSPNHKYYDQRLSRSCKPGGTRNPTMHHFLTSSDKHTINMKDQWRSCDCSYCAHWRPKLKKKNNTAKNPRTRELSKPWGTSVASASVNVWSFYSDCIVRDDMIWYVMFICSNSITTKRLAFHEW